MPFLDVSICKLSKRLKIIFNESDSQSYVRFPKIDTSFQRQVVVDCQRIGHTSKRLPYVLLFLNLRKGPKYNFDESNSQSYVRCLKAILGKRARERSTRIALLCDISSEPDQTNRPISFRQIIPITGYKVFYNT